MKTRRRAAAPQTRARILETATRQFAEVGFKKVTVRDICRGAHANVAAVNYHFRDKLGLYRDVVEQAIAVMTALTERARQAVAGRSPEDKLRAYVSVVSEGIFAHGSDSWLHQLITREMADPTPVVAALVERGLRPRLELLAAILAELLERPAGDERVLLCASSVHAQILMFRPGPVADRVRTELRMRRLTPALVVDHIVRFSLAGLDGYGRRQRSAAAAAPTPTNTSVPGSGTAAGGR